MMSIELKDVKFSAPQGDRMTNDIASVFQQTTRCPICLMKYNNPRRLQCDHSFCKNCLQGEIDRQKQKESGELSCIVCQEPIILPKNGVDQLDGMLVVHDITQFYHATHPQPKIQCNRCNGGYCSSCINLVCHRCDKYIAMEFCTDCFEGFCSRCAEEHEKTTGDHILVDMDQAHDMIKDTSDDEEESGGNDQVQVVGVAAGAEIGEGTMKVEKRDAYEEEDSDSNRSELDFVYDVSGLNESEQLINNAAAIAEEEIVQTNGEEMEEQNGSLELIRHTTVNTEEPPNDDKGSANSTDDQSGDSDSEFNFVYEVNNEDKDSNEEDEGESNEGDSPTSSQSGVAMAYEINQQDSYEEDEGGKEEESEREEQEESDRPAMEDEETALEDRSMSSEQFASAEHSSVRQGKRERRVTISEEREVREITPNPPKTSPVHYYEDLQEIVNATVSVNIPPDEVERLSPSAPQSEKRRRVARIKPDMTHEPRLPESYYEIKSLKWCSRITVGFVLVLTICTLVFAGLAISSYLLSSQDSSEHIFQDYNVLVDRTKPFWSRKTTIDTSGAYDSTYYYETDIYLTECKDLVEKEISYAVNTSGTQSDRAVDLTVEIPTASNGRYVYLAPGSKISFNVLVYSDYTQTRCTSEFNIYNDYDDFLGDEGLQAVYTRCIDIKKSAQDTPVTFTYTVREANFYFVTLSVPSEDSYSVNVTVEGQNYDTVQDYITKCTITSSVDTLRNECNFELLRSSVVWDLRDYCMIAETRPLISSSTTSFVRFSISHSPNIFRNFGYIVILVPLPLYFVLCLLAWMCFKGCNVMYVKCRNMHFQHEYQVTEI